MALTIGTGIDIGGGISFNSVYTPPQTFYTVQYLVVAEIGRAHV